MLRRLHALSGKQVEYTEHRRKSKRYAVHWKAAVVFDHAATRPTLHTETYDLSAGGGAIRTEYGDLTGSMVTLLLAQPPRLRGEQPRMLRVPARVVSSVQTPGRPGYRHGLSFVRSAGDGLEGLEQLLEKTVSATPAPSPAPVGRLEALKRAAQAKLAEEARAAQLDPRKDREQRVSEALGRAYRYFKEMVEQLDVVKPAYPGKGYAIPGVPEFGDFAWDFGKVDLDTREIAPETSIFTRVTLDFRLSKGKPMLKVVRDFPGCERLQQLLKDNGIQFSCHETRNQRGALTQMAFGIPCEVIARVELAGNFDSGRLLLRMRNVERFGMTEHVIAPEAVTQESLEELTGVILGETSKLGPLILRNA